MIINLRVIYIFERIKYFLSKNLKILKIQKQKRYGEIIITSHSLKINYS